MPLVVHKPWPPPAPPGKLTDERREKLRRLAGPYDPPLRDGKYADKGQVVKITCGNAKGQWGLVCDIKMNQYTVRRLDGGTTDASMFHDLLATDLSLDRFIKAKAEWEAKAPLYQRTLQDDRKGMVHSSWTPNMGSAHLRLTDRSAALSERAKPGSGAGYYYAAITSDQHTLPVAAPQRIDASQVQPLVAADAQRATNGEADSAKAKSSYYYAHRRKIDFHVPTPPPQRIG